MNKTLYFSILFMLSICVSAFSSEKSISLFVSHDGNDQWSGKLADPNTDGSDGPFATLEKARDTIRALKKKGGALEDGVTVYLRKGEYFIEDTFTLSAEDNGSTNAPIVYQPYKNERVRITGGISIDQFKSLKNSEARKRFRPSARGHIVYTNLKEQGINDFGELKNRGFGRPVYKSALELFFKGEPMTLARWPNDGWLKIKDVPKGQDGGQFTYEEKRPKNWQDSNNIWVHGFWTRDWADSYERIKTLDVENHLIQTYPPHGVYGYTKGQRFYFLNVMEELDSPGEWYLDRNAGNLYFWPPESIDKNDAYVSLTTEPLIQLKDVQHTQFKGMAFEYTRGNAIEMDGGSNNLIAGCLLRNIGNIAVTINGGEKNGVQGCDIHNTGDGGIRINGGDRNSLTPAGHFAVNNDIHRYSRSVITYRPAVRLHGVGNRLAHNHIHHGPHCGVLFSGNEHMLEFNEIHHVCYETGDVGAFYIGRDWTERGSVVKHNYFHHIEGPYTHGAMSVYLDDAASGNTIFGNIFYKASKAAFVGGGRDNLIENNIFVECDPSVHFDARGLNWAAKYIKKGGGWRMYEKLKSVNYDQPPYSKKYPELVPILEEKPHHPMGNKVIRNISVKGKWLNLQRVEKEWVHFEDNLVDEDPHFVDLENQDFRLRSHSPAFDLGFKPIPVEKIGLIEDEYRSMIPD